MFETKKDSFCSNTVDIINQLNRLNSMGFAEYTTFLTVSISFAEEKKNMLY